MKKIYKKTLAQSFYKSLFQGVPDHKAHHNGWFMQIMILSHMQFFVLFSVHYVPTVIICNNNKFEFFLSLYIVYITLKYNFEFFFLYIIIVYITCHVDITQCLTNRYGMYRSNKIHRFKYLSIQYELIIKGIGSRYKA